MDRVRATAGTLLAGVALVAAAVVAVATPDTLGLVVGAVIAAAGFSARRHGWVTRRWGGSAGVIGGTALVIGGGMLFVTLETTSQARIASGIVALLGIGCAGLGVAEWRDTPPAILIEHIRVVLLGTAVGLGGLVIAGLFGSLPEWLLGGADIAPPQLVSYALAQTAVFLGFGISTVGFVRLSKRPWSYLDLRWPTRRALVDAVVGTVAVFAVGVTVQLLLSQLGVEFVEHGVEDRILQGGPGMLATAILFSFVASGMGEELLYRNGVQKYFAERFSPTVAIVLASLVFTVVHVPAYRDADPLATLGTVTVVFVLSLVLGYTYQRTRNVLVPALIHGSYNAVLWLLVFAGG